MSAHLLPIRVSAAASTAAGVMRVDNEDHWLARAELGLFVVADGVGGPRRGEVASTLACSAVERFFEATPSTPAGEPARLIAAIETANADIHHLASSRPEHRGMGCTLVALHALLDSGSICVAHVGDARCYRLRAGTIEQLTRDHTLVNETRASDSNLTQEELSRLPHVVTRALGVGPTVCVDARVEEAQSGDIYLLCSDGLWYHLGDHEMLDAVQSASSLGEAADRLVDRANRSGGMDNISVLLVRIEEAG